MARARARRATRLGEVALNVVCPLDHRPLEQRGEVLACGGGHGYPLVGSIPVLVDPEREPTQRGYWATADDVERARRDDAPAPVGDGVDPYVAHLIVGTHGNLYRELGDLPRYPIPAFPPLATKGARVLDLGCNWGRWTIAAARAGHIATGVDPSLEAIVAATRIGWQLGEPVEYAVADARALPFADGSFDVVFSYSVLQHLSRAAVAEVVGEAARVLAPGGVVLAQMANVFGVRNLYNQARRGFREAREFEVRYWRPSELRRAFAPIGPAALSVDGFFSLNAQESDADLLPPKRRAVVRASSALRRASRRAPALAAVADSLWVEARKAA